MARTISDALGRIGELVGKSNILFTASGNKAIFAALKALKQDSRLTVFVQDQGGWLTYFQYPARLKMGLSLIRTDYGLITDFSALGSQLEPGSIALINSMPGYAAIQDMKQVERVCRENCCFLINDVSGSVGSDDALFGDLILGSFGKDKPVNLSYGGFIATDDELLFGRLSDIRGDSPGLDCGILCERLDDLPDRIRFFSAVRKKIINDLSDFDIIHRNEPGINVIVKYDDAARRESIIDYCDANKYPFTECPRYIRVRENAISIEVKRL